MAVVWMAAASLAAWLAVTAVMTDANPELAFGMAGPLLAASATWIAVARSHAAAPERVMSVMVTAFVAKMLFFGAYVAVMLKGLELRRTPFVVSFTIYFVALYAMEALFLKRLFAGGRERLP